MFKPKHTVFSVAKQLEEGLRDGSLSLNDNEGVIRREIDQGSAYEKSHQATDDKEEVKIRNLLWRRTTETVAYRLLCHIFKSNEKT